MIYWYKIIENTRRFLMPKYVFDHVHLSSMDPIKTAEFYEKTFGGKRKKSGDLPGGRQMASLTIDGTPFLITTPRDKAKASSTSTLEHFGFRTDNIEKAVAELKAMGLKFTMEITAISPTTKIAFFNSPDGINMELMEGGLEPQPPAKK
jgi:predicted enzyme related to lactoylglutathione lyase